jgi:branched-chain amino acid aminotransferase
MRLAKIV